MRAHELHAHASMCIFMCVHSGETLTPLSIEVVKSHSYQHN